jgi:hypothetical protein
MSESPRRGKTGLRRVSVESQCPTQEYAKCPILLKTWDILGHLGHWPGEQDGGLGNVTSCQLSNKVTFGDIGSASALIPSWKKEILRYADYGRATAPPGRRSLLLPDVRRCLTVGE